MARLLRTRRTWLIALALLAATTGVIVSLLVLAGPNDVAFTATLYSDVIRFEADGVASLRVTIYDLSENELWSSGQVMGEFVDWNRTNERGERLANGFYMYLAQGWDSSDTLVLSKTGKVVLLPGDQVELKAAPMVTISDTTPWQESPVQLGPLAVDVDHSSESWAFGQVSIGTTDPSGALEVVGNWVLGGNKKTNLTQKAFRYGVGHYNTSEEPFVAFWGLSDSANNIAYFGGGTTYGNAATILKFYTATNNATTIGTERMRITSSGDVGIGTTMPAAKLEVVGNWVLGGNNKTNLVQKTFRFGVGHYNTSEEPFAAFWGLSDATSNIGYFGGGTSYGNAATSLRFYTAANNTTTVGTERMRITETGNVGIGTTNATDKLTIQGSSGNLIACYPSSSRAAGAAVFRVESDGDVYADGTVYSAATAVGSADVAERINVSEWVEAGDVVEIDPEHVGFFRKASGVYSRRVAGVISTSPGVILGNDVDPASDEWNDNRPVLAIAGCVPVKVSTENGPIAVGDLLVSSSVPGVAMKGDLAVSIGAVVGKAMEPLDGGERVIMAQVTLR